MIVELPPRTPLAPWKAFVCFLAGLVLGVLELYTHHRLFAFGCALVAGMWLEDWGYRVRDRHVADAEGTTLRRAIFVVPLSAAAQYFARSWWRFLLGVTLLVFALIGAWVAFLGILGEMGIGNFYLYYGAAKACSHGVIP